MAPAAVVFHGTEDEMRDLLNALTRNCACTFGLMGVRLTTCAPHDALVHDQRWLDHLLFARRICTRLEREEWKRQRH